MTKTLTAKTVTHETIHRVPVPKRHFTLLLAADGQLLRLDSNGGLTKSYDADDAAMWLREGNSFRHVVTDTLIEVDGGESKEQGSCIVRQDKSQQVVSIAKGPAELPSLSLAHLREHGWVCLPSVFDDTTLAALEQVAASDRYAGATFDAKTPPICQHPAIARMAAEPVSLWLMRCYMGTDAIRLGHPPSFAILEEDDGERDVQGWHSDFPYMWGFEGTPPFGRIPAGSGAAVLGVQRNVCISPFTREGGATAFKLGSSKHDQGPPEEWGLGSAYARPGHRAKAGLPYCGPEADIVEAPGGSIILYDSRTWHRAGVNATPKRRSAMLQAMIPAFMMPFFDCSDVYHSFLSQPFVDELTERERREIRNLMINHMEVGPHRIAIRPDPVLTELLQSST